MSLRTNQSVKPGENTKDILYEKGFVLVADKKVQMLQMHA